MCGDMQTMPGVGISRQFPSDLKLWKAEVPSPIHGREVPGADTRP